MFSLLDWVVVGLYVLVTTLVGAKLAGKQATIRDFFLGGRKLPWWAISGSIVATEISTATFVGVPAITYARGGNLTYLQLGIGAIMARIIVGFFFVPRYYEREIYSPYDYMGQRLGARVKEVTTLLFFVGAILGHGARIFIAAILLRHVVGVDLVTTIWLMALVGVAWTMLGGITTVIWTDVVQFCILVFGALAILWYAIQGLPGSLTEAAAEAYDAGKFQLFDLTLDPALNYTLWIGILAMPFLNVAAFGLDQVMAQRMFCCKNAADARKAILWSTVGQLVAVIMLFVGIGLYCYFRAFPMTPEEAALCKDNDAILPIFIAREVPHGVRGLIIAAALAAAISTLEGALAALSQASISAFKWRAASLANRLTAFVRIRGDVALSRLMIVLWGVALALMATACIVIRDRYDNLIDLALGLTAYTYGALLGIFLLAFFPTGRDDAGLPWAVGLSMLAVFSLSVHETNITIGSVTIDWSHWVVWIASAALLWLTLVSANASVGRTLIIVGGVMICLLLHHVPIYLGESGSPVWPSPYWGFPISTLMTFVVGYGVGNTKHPARHSKLAAATA